MAGSRWYTRNSAIGQSGRKLSLATGRAWRCQYWSTCIDCWRGRYKVTLLSPLVCSRWCVNSPLVSIFSHLVRSSFRPREIHFVYGTKADSDLDRQRILFLPRLMDVVAAASDPNVTLSVFLTGTGQKGSIEHGQLPNRTFGRRLKEDDLLQALDGYNKQSQAGKSDRSRTVCYVCGPPNMTDEFVSFLTRQPGMTPERVLCEKWW